MPLAICLVSNSNHQHFNHSHSNLPPLVPFNNLLLQELVTLVGFSQQLHSNNKTNLVDFNLHQLNSNSLVAFNLLLLSSSNSLETFNKHLLNQLRLVRKMLMVDLWIFQILLEKLPKRMIIKVQQLLCLFRRLFNLYKSTPTNQTNSPIISTLPNNNNNLSKKPMIPLANLENSESIKKLNIYT